MREAASGTLARFAVGLSDGISKLAAQALLAPVLGDASLRLLCHEGETDELLGELALHRLDLVLASQPAPHNQNMRLTSERLVASPVDWYGPASIVRKSAIDHFPKSLASLPILLPTGHSSLRSRLDRWLETQRIAPRVAGEFEDSALMAVFGARGLGVFPLAEFGAGDVPLLRGLRWLGRSPEVKEEVHAIVSRRGRHHPLTQRVLAGVEG